MAQNGRQQSAGGLPNAQNPMRFAWQLLTVAAERGSERAAADADRVRAKIDNQEQARRGLKLIYKELADNGIE